MLKKLVFSSYFAENFENILLYIKKDSIVRAQNFGIKVLDDIETLKEFPFKGLEIENNCRQILFNKNYKVIYEIIGDEVRILSIRNVKLKN